MQDPINHTPIKKRRPIWPFIIIGLLGAHVAAMAVAFTIAQRDRSFLVVPNYYEKAQHWDQERAERLASTNLGWHVKVEPAQVVDVNGRRAVNFELTDATGQAVKGASLRVEYFHHAHPGDQQLVDLMPASGDARAFPATLPMRYTGIWEFHFIATAGAQTYVNTQTEYVLTN